MRHRVYVFKIICLCKFKPKLAMLSIRTLTVFTLFAFILACSKKDTEDLPTDPPVKEEVKAIQDLLSKTPDFSEFASSFVKVKFSDADLQQGITVFAPSNSAITSYDPNARITAKDLSEEQIKDHIVKGIYKLIALEHGQTLTSLSGKTLTITLDGDTVFINGAKITSFKDGNGHVVFGVNGVLSRKPGIAEITVYNSTLWSTTDTIGKPEAGVEVQLFATFGQFSKNDYTAQGKTDASGRVTFNVPEGTYFMTAYKGDKSSYFGTDHINNKMVTYKVIGVFQTQQQINTTPHLNGAAPGDYIFADLNNDGKIDKNDKAETYTATITISTNKTIKAKSLIGYLYNHVEIGFQNKQEAQQMLDKVYADLGNWHQLQTVLDGMLTDEADCTGLPSWCSIDKYEFTPTNSNITNLWQDAYNMIGTLNRILIQLPKLNLPTTETDAIIGQTKALRGYIHLQLLNYFPYLPLLKTVMPDQWWGQTDFFDAIAFVKADLTDALSKLPAKWPGSDYRRIGGNAIKVLLARAAFAENNDWKMKEISAEIIASNAYQLVDKSQIFVNDNNSEIIWNIAPSIASQNAAFFADTITRNFHPAIRYTEVLLMNSEAHAKSLENNMAGVNMVRSRRGVAPITFDGNSLATIQEWWRLEQHREGLRFMKAKKWNTWQTALTNMSGMLSYKIYLPIPQVVMEHYPSLRQNVGY